MKQFVDQYPWPSESAMRGYILRAEKFGLQKAFVRVGRRVLIQLNIFFDLIREQNKE